MAGIPIPPAGVRPTNVNFTDTTPAPPAGAVNVKWQGSAVYPDPNVPEIPCRDVSAYYFPSGAAGGGAGVGARSNVPLTTGLLATNAIETGTVALGKGFTLISLSVTCKCRVTLYATAAARTADAGTRPPDGGGLIPQPTPGTDHGVIADFYLNNSAKLNWLCSPEVDGSNGDVPTVANIYYSITNLDTAQAVGIIFTSKVTEA
jgi:hypothetical protein